VTLSNEELLRYSRQLILPEVGKAGQQRLKDSRVLVIGAGGLGSPAALYLAAAGIGKLGLVDSDAVELSNLHRQVLHGTGGLGHHKVESAAERLRDLNPQVRVETFDVRLHSDNAFGILDGFDLVVDGSDNFPTRYLVNDACVLSGKPYVYGAIFRFDGQVSVFAAQGGPCYRCLFREPPPPGLVPACDIAGVLGVLPGVIGSLQALEAIKLLLGIGSPMVSRLLCFNALSMDFRELSLSRDPECPVCGTHPTVTELIDYEAFCGTTTDPPPGPEISVDELSQALSTNGQLVLVDVREEPEWEICRLEGSALVPLGQLAGRLEEFNRSSQIVTVCHHGVRSLRAQRMFQDAGFSHVRSLRGGIEEWARRIDPGMPRY